MENRYRDYTVFYHRFTIIRLLLFFFFEFWTIFTPSSWYYRYTSIEFNSNI